MAWSQADIDRLEAAIGSGIFNVTFDGPPRRSVTYQSIEAMRSVLAQMKREVAATEGTPPVTYRRVAFRRGFDPPDGAG